jgi:DNA polymerase-3 subunit epsilon
MNKNNYAIVDIETTGGKPSQEGITEIAIVISDGSYVLEEFSCLVNPQKPIHSFVARLTGITQSMVANQPKFAEVSAKVYELLKDCVFVAHNVNFDAGFLTMAFKGVGIEFDPPRICTVQMSRKVLPGKRSYSLGKLCQEIGIPLRDRHRALGDARATAKLFHLLLAEKAEPDLASFVKASKNPFSLTTLASDANKLKSSMGIVYFINSKTEYLHIAFCQNVAKEAKNLFAKKSKWKQETSSLDAVYSHFGLELLLLEAKELGKHSPKGNRKKALSISPLILSGREIWMETQGDEIFALLISPQKVVGVFKGDVTYFQENYANEKSIFSDLDHYPNVFAKLKSWSLKSRVKKIKIPWQ